MKPIKLVIEGINSFDAPQTLDFETVGRSNLFCICGKTGAGKTTIFDSIIFALYGKSRRGNIADIVNLSRMTAFVSFEFEERGEVYKIERTVKCKHAKDGDGKKTDERIYGGTECTVYKNGVPVANTADEAAEIVDAAIGIDMTEFKNVYLLEQGEYAEFLKKSPARQSETVGKIFSLMRFGDVYKRAKEREKEALGEAEKAQAAMDAYKDAAPDSLKKVKTELAAERAALTNLNKDVESVRAELDGLSKARDEYISAAEKSKAVKQQAERLQEATLGLDAAERDLVEFDKTRDAFAEEKIKTLRDKLLKLTELNALDKEYMSSAAEYESKAAALAEKTRVMEKAAFRAAELKDLLNNEYSVFDEAAARFIAAAHRLKKPSAAVRSSVELLSSEQPKSRINGVFEIIYSLKEEKTAFDGMISEIEGAEKRLAELRRECDSALAKIEKFAAESALLADKRSTAESDEKAAKAALDKATLCSHAAAVRAELKSGETCPVCGGVYDGRVGESSSDVETLKKLYAEKQDRVKTAAEELTAINSLLEKTKGDYDRADKERNSLEEKISELKEKAEDTGVEPRIYSELSAAMGKARESAARYRTTEAELNERGPAVAAAKAECDGARASLAEIAKKTEALKAELGENLGKTDGEIGAVREEVAALESKIAAEDKRRSELVQEEKAARAAVETLKFGLDEAAKACPVDVPQFDEEYYNAQKSRWDALLVKQTETKTNIAALEAGAKTLSELAEKMKEHEAVRAEYIKRADRYATIADMTKGKIMLNYVATEYIEQFTAIASEILGELSHGKYTMFYDAENGFTVSDFLNNGKPRKTDTLSGGELFLASLSVAIAIARAVGRGNNAFFFLDEGFGTLDDELIDTVYGALEALSRDCLVGVISHADALIDRMPSRVEIIEATDTVGSRIEY